MPEVSADGQDTEELVRQVDRLLREEFSDTDRTMTTGLDVGALPPEGSIATPDDLAAPDAGAPVMEEVGGEAPGSASPDASSELDDLLHQGAATEEPAETRPADDIAALDATLALQADALARAAGGAPAAPVPGRASEGAAPPSHATPAVPARAAGAPAPAAAPPPGVSMTGAAPAEPVEPTEGVASEPAGAPVWGVAARAWARVEPALLAAAGAVSRPLAGAHPAVRQWVGWLAVVTAVDALVLWVFLVGFREPVVPVPPVKPPAAAASHGGKPDAHAEADAHGKPAGVPGASKPASGGHGSQAPKASKPASGGHH